MISVISSVNDYRMATDSEWDFYSGPSDNGDNTSDEDDGHDYSKGKIYQVKSAATERIYVGSTIVTLPVRLKKHKSDYGIGEGACVNDLFEEFGKDNFYIELIEEFPCNTKRELRKREQFWIDTLRDTCINKYNSYRTKEYKKEKARQADRKHKSTHRERVNEKQKLKAREPEIVKKRHEYYEENKSHILDKTNAYKKRNKEIIKAKNAAWYQANIETERIKRRERSAALREKKRLERGEN
jgi:hypothetical protein